MNYCQAFLIVLVFIFNLLFAQPSLADLPKFNKNPDYIEITQKIQELTSAPESSPEKDKELAALQFAKYTIESGAVVGQCTNNTGKTIAVYVRDPEAEEEDYKSSYDSELYFLADGQTTDEELDCDGFYLANDTKASTVSPTGKPQELVGPAAIKILDGTNLVVKTNPDTGNLEFDAPLSKVILAGEINWFIPNVSQAAVNSTVPNAPTSESEG
jgi:hypothetical protein